MSMMTPQEPEATGRLVKKSIVRPAVEVDCSTWDTLPGETPRTTGRFVKPSLLRPAVAVDCCDWREIPAGRPDVAQSDDPARGAIPQGEVRQVVGGCDTDVPLASLQILVEAELGQRLQLNGDSFVFGRDPDCQFVIQDSAINKQHAQITREENGFYIEDLKSCNGTFVNNQRITTRTMLNRGDRITIGHCQIQFDVEKKVGHPA
jgi:hypothetical protein